MLAEPDAARVVESALTAPPGAYDGAMITKTFLAGKHFTSIATKRFPDQA
jgi:hypothetical protein